MIAASTASIWPARAAYLAATVFIGASGAINITYGWRKGADPASCLTWAAVAGAVAIVFSLSWAATIRAVESRRWAAAVICTAALLLSGAYSVMAALGSAAGGRSQAAATETASTGARKRAQAAYDAAESALAALKASRPVAEIQALVDAARPVCRVVVASTLRETVCTKPPALLAELGRAKERERLQGALDSASKQLAAAPPPPANTDATALSRYLAAIGVSMPADRLNDLLVLLSVLMIEAGGGLALSVGMALAAAPGRRTMEIMDAEPMDRGHRKPAQARILSAVGEHSGQAERTDRTLASGVRPLAVQPSAVQAWLAEQGGRATISMRRLGGAIGRSASAVHDELRRLQASGAVTLMPGPRGTLIALRPNWAVATLRS